MSYHTTNKLQSTEGTSGQASSFSSSPLNNNSVIFIINPEICKRIRQKHINLCFRSHVVKNIPDSFTVS